MPPHPGIVARASAEENHRRVQRAAGRAH
jgi:hypothetical protein